MLRWRLSPPWRDERVALQRDLLGWVGSRSPLPELTSTRWFVVLYSVVPAALVLLRPREIVELTTLSGAIYGAVFLAPLLYALHGRRAPRRVAAWAALAVGGLTVLLWRPVVLARIPELGLLHEVVAGALAALLVFAPLQVGAPRRATPPDPPN